MMNRKKWVFTLSFLCLWLSCNCLNAIFAQTFVAASTVNPTQMYAPQKSGQALLAQTFFTALQEDDFELLLPFVATHKQLKKFSELNNKPLKNKQAKLLRNKVLRKLHQQFFELRQKAASKGINWDGVSFDGFEYQAQKLYNLRFFFKDKDREKYWVELETYSYGELGKYYLREYINSQFEAVNYHLPYAAQSNKISDKLFKKPTQAIDILYKKVGKKAKEQEIIQLKSLINRNDFMLDSLLLLINEMPLSSRENSHIEELMLAQQNGAKIQLGFQNLNQFVTQKFTTTQLNKHQFQLIKTDIPDWSKFIFKGRTPISAKVLLLKWKKDLRYFESKILELWIEG